MAELEPDIVYEIISRVPSLQALDCCKSVSKEWEHLIDDPYFMTSFCQRTNSVSGFFIQGSRNSQDVSRFVSLHDDDDNEGSSKDLMMRTLPRILASCRQGLLCCLVGHTYSVCKPTTGESQDLPSPPGPPPWKTVSVAILVQGSSPLRYKIVRLSDPLKANNSYECQVFDSEAWGWRDAGAIKLPTTELIINPSPSSVISAANSVCWLTTYGNIVEFCEPNKSFHKFPLPETIVGSNNRGEYSYKSLVEYQGRLGLVCAASRKDNRCFELWVREPGMRNNTWVKKMEFTSVEDSAYPVGFYNPEIALFKLCDELTFYRVEDSSSLRKVEIDWLHGMGKVEVFPFRSDSEPVHLGRSCQTN